MILSRLKKAIKEQNWFAVMLEMLIVVIGVVIGFQITEWGQSRADREQEMVYLNQLSLDLKTSERLILEANAFNQKASTDLIKFIRAFSEEPPPPTDSLFKWGWNSRSIERQAPILGTAEALISTGDLRLIRNDSLRTGIVAYLDQMRLMNDIANNVSSAFLLRYGIYLRHFDRDLAARVSLSEAAYDSLQANDHLFPGVPDSGTRPYDDPDGMLANRELYGALRDLLDTHADQQTMHDRTLVATRELSDQLKRELAQ